MTTDEKIDELLKRTANIEAILFKAFTSKDFPSIIAQVTKRYDSASPALSEDNENSKAAISGNGQLPETKSGDTNEAGSEGKEINAGDGAVAGEPTGDVVKND